MKKHVRRIPATYLVLILLLSCTRTAQQASLEKYVVVTQVTNPEWSKNAVIYEVNIRQHTPDGTFQAFMQDMPRLEEMGIDILWLMPIFPIGEKFRKATQTGFVYEIAKKEQREKYLGSYYSIRDYRAVNPEFGTIQDLKALVDKAHELGMHVILDIAINHTAWDHEWVTTHPEYYTRIDTTNPPWNPEWMKQHPDYYRELKKLGMTYPDPENETDWWDTADLNYDNVDLHEEMKEIFTYWIAEVGIDGYRCDVAGKVPCVVWNKIRSAIDDLDREVFMLAEDEHEYCLYEKAFGMNYGWELHHRMNELAQGRIDLTEFKKYFHKHDSIFDPAIYRMNFITNHDENSWNGTIFERLGDAAEVYAFLTFTVPGMPMIYSGQENGLNKRLAFFTKDTIPWTNNRWETIYSDFIRVKKENQALWNGVSGGEMEILDTKAPGIFALQRIRDNSKVIAIANLSDSLQQVRLGIDGTNFSTLLGVKGYDLSQEFLLGAYEYMLLVKEE